MNFSAATIAMAENRSDVVDFMMPFIEDHLSIAVKFPEENENMMFFNIFDVCLKVVHMVQQRLRHRCRNEAKMFCLSHCCTEWGWNPFTCGTLWHLWRNWCRKCSCE